MNNQSQKGRTAALVLLIVLPIIGIISLIFYFLVSVTQPLYNTDAALTATGIHGIFVFASLIGWVPFSNRRYTAAIIMSFLPLLSAMAVFAFLFTL